VDLIARLGLLRSALRRLYFLDGFGRTLLVSGLSIGLLFVVDWALILPFGLRITIESLLAVGAILVLVLRCIRPWVMRISDDDLALLVERARPALQHRLVSAVQLVRTRGVRPEFNSPELIDRLAGETARDSAGLDFRSILTSRNVLSPTYS
jgi:hypothetical protein